MKFEQGKYYKSKKMFFVVYPTLAMAKIAGDDDDREKNDHSGVTWIGIGGSFSREDCTPTDASLKTITWVTNYWTKYFGVIVPYSYPHDVMLFLEEEKGDGVRFLKFAHPCFIGWIVLENKAQRWWEYMEQVPIVPVTQ